MVTIVPMSSQEEAHAVLIHPHGKFISELPGGPQNMSVAKVAVCSKPTVAYAARAGVFQSLT
ncbi:hypothetical protein SAMN05192575_102200 [Nocardioides alpinus]|uniref:Uncharacterized protein n=1 Tax=Nocardioides alpinus TaxID=748909 RepID=A0A1I0XAF6_9ACTN|nr:hypothetical protein SAMN05192575_102200 [Nocardioides alpinus]